MFGTAVADGVLRARRPGTRWLATGHAGGLQVADAAYVVSVPGDFGRTDPAAYATRRRADAGFGATGPALLTGVDIEHAWGARDGPVAVVATAGLSNPAALPVPPPDAGGDADGPEDAGSGSRPDRGDADRGGEVGTVNLLVGTTRALDDGALAGLLATAVEAKAATLSALAGVPGTTSDAVVVGSDPGGEPAAFAGSATPVGAAARACVRDAVRAGLAAAYPDGGFPPSAAAATHGVYTDRKAAVFRP